MSKKIFFFPVLLVAALLVVTGFSSKEDYSSKQNYDFSKFSTRGMDLNFNVPLEEEVLPFNTIVTPKYYLFLGKTYLGFKEALGFKESRGDYHVVNDYGYMGIYQFSGSTLRMMGFIYIDYFLYDTCQYDEAFYVFVAFN